ncbi:hypothetical protein [Janibacter corallicola]|uniref:hypothetical protein n=1 Tax=Janibacter corallicola TaxID=415212 RepID=UPI00082AF6A8|nr:hypothetical protein [Janibacter corallicola]
MTAVEEHLAALRAGRVVRLPLSPTRVLGQTLLVVLVCVVGALCGLGLVLDGDVRSEPSLGLTVLGWVLLAGGTCALALFAFIAVSRLRGREELILSPDGLIEVSRTGRTLWLQWHEIQTVEVVWIGGKWPARGTPFVVCRMTGPRTVWLGRDYTVRKKALLELLESARRWYLGLPD